MTDLSRWLPSLAPPPGGLARLQQSVRGRRHAPTYRPRLVLAATAALALLLALPPVVRRHLRTRQLVDALHEATAVPATGIQVAHGAALALPTGQPHVRLYLVDTLPRED